MNENEANQLFNKLNSVGKIEFPKFKFPSIPKEGLILSKEKQKIEFKNGEIYDKYTNILHLANGETFIGEINKGKEYTLVKGEYKWPSGQIYNGKFDKNYKSEGILTYQTGYSYNGQFVNEKFEGKGEFKWNEDEYIKGNFKNGYINGEATVNMGNKFIEGNFTDSQPNGKIEKYNININNHVFEFPKFHLKDNNIEEDIIILKKDGNNIFLNNKIYENLKIETNREKIKPSDNDLYSINQCFDLIKGIVPKYELPSIPEEGIIVLKDGDGVKNFKNGKIENIENNGDVECDLLTKKNDKFFDGLINNEENGLILLDGKYVWPSGQEYIGNFNKNNRFEQDEDGELKMGEEWAYKGGFKDGNLNNYGIFNFKNGDQLEGYFLDGKINGESRIKKGNIIINGYITNSPINEVEFKIDNNNYKIRKLSHINDDNLLIVDKNENEYFIIHYTINGKNVTLIEYNVIDGNEKALLLNNLNLIIEIPPFEPCSIREDGLIVQDDENDKELFFENGIVYNRETKILTLPNKETFKGELKKKANKYVLDEGEYEWPDGQKYKGKFNEKNNFEGNEDAEIYVNEWNYKGGFKDGEPNGKGDITWKNGDYVKGNFEKGKIFGETNIKKKDIIFQGNYTSSIINGTISNINTLINEHNYKISNLTIKKGSIEEDNLDFQEEDGKTHKIHLKKENKQILPAEIYKIFEFDEKDLNLLIKALSRVRKINLPYYSPPSIKDGVEIIQDKNNVQINKLIFPNNETFKGKIIHDKNKILLFEGEYEWPFGQKYIGKFKDNKFDSTSAELIIKDEWTYKGGFKDGYFEGDGTFQNDKDLLISGHFEKGKIVNNIVINSNNYFFEGSNLDSINDLYIKTFNVMIQNQIYELSEFKMSDQKIVFKKDKIEFQKELSHELKLRMIENLIIKAKSSKQKYFFNEPYKNDESNENKLKILKIQDNIHSQKLSSLSIYYNRLAKKNRNVKGNIGKLIGVSLNQHMSLNDIVYKIQDLKKGDIEDFKSKMNYFQKMKEISKEEKYNKIEEKEIVKICNSKMIKDMENEIKLISNDIKTMKKERAKIEKEKNNKIKELIDLNYYYELINNDYNELNNENKKIEDDNNKIEHNLKNITENNNIMKDYLINIKKNKNTKNNKNEISKKVQELENNNNKILKEIKKKEEIIRKGNDELEDIIKRIKILEHIKEEEEKKNL